MCRFIGCKLLQPVAAVKTFFLLPRIFPPQSATMAATKRRRFMVNIPPEVAPLVEARAKSLRRSMSNYLEWLVTKDLEGGGAYPETDDRDLRAVAESAVSEIERVAANDDLARAKADAVRAKNRQLSSDPLRAIAAKGPTISLSPRR